MSTESTTEKPPLAVFQAQGLIVEALTTVHEDAHYLKQLKLDKECTFVQTLANADELRTKVRALGYADLTNVIHLTETWERKLYKTVSAGLAKALLGKNAKNAKQPESGDTYNKSKVLQKNPKKIFLSKDQADVCAVAHELVHWLDHPNWAAVFGGNTWVNEGATDALMRCLTKVSWKSGGGLKNAVYDKQVADLMEHMVTEGDKEIDEKSKGANSKFTIEDLMSAYFDGNTESLKKVAKTYNNDDASKEIDKIIADEKKEAGKKAGK